MRPQALLLIASTALVACGSAPLRVDQLTLPGTWQGTLPCADCAGVRVTLTLKPGGEYWLERVYLGTKDGDRVFNERARWRRGDLPDLVEMFGARAGLEYFKLAPEGALQKLGTRGQVPDGAPQLLARLPEAATRFGPVGMNALYRYGADAALLQDCMTGAKYNAVGGAAAAELERAYLAAQAQGEPRRALLAVTIGPRPAGEEGWPERVSIDKLERLTDAKVCGRDTAVTPETGGWLPVKIDHVAVAEAEVGRWSFAGGRFSGKLPCNSASGGYTLESAALSFKVLATTRMACAEPVMAREQALVAGLNAVRKWTVTDGRLELRDAEGAIRVELRPVP